MLEEDAPPRQQVGRSGCKELLHGQRLARDWSGPELTRLAALIPSCTPPYRLTHAYQGSLAHLYNNSLIIGRGPYIWWTLGCTSHTSYQWHPPTVRPITISSHWWLKLNLLAFDINEIDLFKEVWLTNPCLKRKITIYYLNN